MPGHGLNVASHMQGVALHAYTADKPVTVENSAKNALSLGFPTSDQGEFNGCTLCRSRQVTASPPCAQPAHPAAGSHTARRRQECPLHWVLCAPNRRGRTPEYRHTSMGRSSQSQHSMASMGTHMTFPQHVQQQQHTLTYVPACVRSLSVK
jgi:hypothetical protein